MNPQKENELFPTPEPLAVLLVDRLMWAAPHLQGRDDLQILEPSAGSGSFIGPLSARGAVTAIEPFEKAPVAPLEGVDWGAMTMEQLHADLDGERPFDIICGNPPFSLAEEHLRLAFQMLRARGVVGFLLRLGFLASKKRAKFFAAWPPKHVYVLASRPSFMWSYACAAGKHKWFEPPGTILSTCPVCGHDALTVVKTDQYDYCFMVWEQGLSTLTTLSHINTQEGVVE